MIGHNGGPSVAEGKSWRAHCWKVARQALLPTLPIEVLRIRVKRARDLGLEYRTYASVRASTGHDVVAFLFSSNALRVTTLKSVLPQDRAAKLAEVAAKRIALAVAMPPMLILATNPAHLDVAFAAPNPFARFAEARTALRAALGRTPSDRVILIGDTGLEREWLDPGRLAAYLPAERYFGG